MFSAWQCLLKFSLLLVGPIVAMASAAELAGGSSIAHEGLAFPLPRAPAAGGLGSRPSLPSASAWKFSSFWF